MPKFALPVVVTVAVVASEPLALSVPPVTVMLERRKGDARDAPGFLALIAFATAER
jgi:hypothetical protein